MKDGGDRRKLQNMGGGREGCRKGWFISWLGMRNLNLGHVEFWRYPEVSLVGVQYLHLLASCSLGKRSERWKIYFTSLLGFPSCLPTTFPLFKKFWSSSSLTITWLQWICPTVCLLPFCLHRHHLKVKQTSLCYFGIWKSEFFLKHFMLHTRVHHLPHALP